MKLDCNNNELEELNLFYLLKRWLINGNYLMVQYARVFNSQNTREDLLCDSGLWMHAVGFKRLDDYRLINSFF